MMNTSTDIVSELCQKDGNPLSLAIGNILNDSFVAMISQ